MKKLLIFSLFVVAMAASSCASNRVSCPTYADADQQTEQKEANL